MKKISFINRKGAGRPSKHDKGIRHIEREQLKKTSNLHITVKLEKSKAGLKNKQTLALLHKAIKKARLSGLRILHYTLEFDHIHMLIEADNNHQLSRGMQSFGITFSKGINKLKKLQGNVYKNRYHLRLIKTYKEIKNVMNYILSNGVKHKTSSFVNHFNSLVIVRNLDKLYPGFELMIEDTLRRSPALQALKGCLKETLDPPGTTLGKQLC